MRRRGRRASSAACRTTGREPIQTCFMHCSCRPPPHTLTHADAPQGSARVIRCLQDHRKSLTQKCAAALFDHEVRISEDIDFNYAMKKICAWEINQLCKDMPHGHGRVMRWVAGCQWLPGCGRCRQPLCRIFWRLAPGQAGARWEGPCVHVTIAVCMLQLRAPAQCRCQVRLAGPPSLLAGPLPLIQAGGAGLARLCNAVWSWP